MKLYASVQSERATKGQGGNDYLEIKISGQGEIPLWRIIVSPGEMPFMAIYEEGNGVHVWAGHSRKGEKEKSGCDECGGNKICEDCGGCQNCTRACKATIDSHNP